MTSIQSQNAPPAANTVNEAKTSTVDTPANAKSGYEENTIQDMTASISYPTHEWLGDKHNVINKFGNQDIKAEYKILVQNKTAIALYDS